MNTDHEHLAKRLRCWARILGSERWATLPDLLNQVADEIEDLSKNAEFDLRMSIHLERKNDALHKELNELREGNLE